MALSSGEGAQICPVDESVGLNVTNIGLVQGNGQISPCENKRVSILGVVTGIREDQNQRGARFYTFFIQDPTGEEDGFPDTSDGIAIFTGPNRPSVEIGDLVRIEGTVQEYFGLTEIDFRDLVVEILEKNRQLPGAVNLDPPESDQQSNEYYERLEGMLVGLEDGMVIGPTHQGCGFAAINANSTEDRIVARGELSDLGRIINILNTTDVSCPDFPQAAVGDQVGGVVGPLTYEFGQFKVVQRADRSINLNPGEINLEPMPIPSDGQFSVATFNLYDLFSPALGEGEDREIDRQKYEIKLDKIAATISEILHCPTILGLQEVENLDILEELAGRLNGSCGFSYAPTLLEGPDGRGINNAALIDPTLVVVESAILRQRCDRTVTVVNDPSTNCPTDQYPLFSRPPLELHLTVGEDQYYLFVNHFKSKRGGELETEPIRIAQARHLRSMIEETAAVDPSIGIIILGDFNDYENSKAADELTKGSYLVNILKAVPEESRYSYSFGGASQLVDWILVSGNLAEKESAVSIAHLNADYPFSWSENVNGEKLYLRTSDHDIPFVIFQIEAGSEVQPTTVIPQPSSVFPETTPELPAPTSASLMPISEYPEPAAAVDVTGFQATLAPTVESNSSPEFGQEEAEGEPAKPASIVDRNGAAGILIIIALLILSGLLVKRVMAQR